MDDTITDSPYVVSLEGGESLPCEQRMRAETRYSAALEKALGGAEQVVEAFAAFQSAADSEEAPRAEVAALASSWQRACNTAQQAGGRELGEDLDAYFEIRLT